MWWQLRNLQIRIRKQLKNLRELKDWDKSLEFLLNLVLSMNLSSSFTHLKKNISLANRKKCYEKKALRLEIRNEIWSLVHNIVDMALLGVDDSLDDTWMLALRLEGPESTEILNQPKEKSILRTGITTSGFHSILQTSERWKCLGRNLWNGLRNQHICNSQTTSRAVARTFSKCGLDPRDEEKVLFLNHLNKMSHMHLYDALAKNQPSALLD